MKPAIVIVFSRTGHTRRVGAEIAQRLRCPIAEITEPRTRRGAPGYLRSAFEALFGRMPPIARLDCDLREFSMLVVGTPVWAGHLSSPVRSFLARHRGDVTRLAAFCTMGGRDPVNTFDDIAAVCGKPPLATLAISGRDLNDPGHQAKLDEFVAAIGLLRESD
jgi:flavodoxin